MEAELTQRGHRQSQQEHGAKASGEQVQGQDSVAEQTCKDEQCKQDRRPNYACKHFFASRVWKCITLSLVGITPIFGTALAMPKLMDAIGVAPWTLAWVSNFCFAAWVSVQFLYNFIATQWTDPGGTKAVKPVQEVSGQFQIGGNTEPRLFYAPNWCTKCSHWKPPRSHHCSMCGRCVLRMDHHCPFTGNCIGMKNHGHFALFYVFAFIGLFYSGLLCSLAIYHDNPLSGWRQMVGPKFKEHAWLIDKHFITGIHGMAFAIILELFAKRGLEVMVQTVSTVIASLFVMSMGTPALWLVWTNVTTMDRMFPMKEYVQLKDQVFCPLGPGFYRQNGLQNVKDILGPKWWLRLLIPISGGPIDVGPGVAPVPSQDGSEALAARMKQVEEQGVQQEVKSCKELGFDPGPQTAEASNTV